MTFRLFIFDFDGTLADSGPWMIEAINQAAAQYGFRPIDPARIEALRGLDNRAMMRELDIPLRHLPRIVAYVRRLAKSGQNVPLFPGIAPMLQRLYAADVKLAVVSSNSEQTIRRTLEPDCADLIDLYACNAAMFGKSAKFKRIMRRLGIAADQTIAIGDETRDIEAARNARVACGAVAWGYATPALLLEHAPDLLFETPNDIAELGAQVGSMLAQEQAPTRDK